VRQFLVTRTKDGHLHSVHAFAETDEDAQVCRNIAREASDLEADLFLATDLIEVVRSHESYFEEAAA
jgi:hypothetical protein